MIFDFGTSGECLVTRPANERLVAGVNDFVHLKVMRRAELFAAHIALVLFDARMRSHMLS